MADLAQEIAGAAANAVEMAENRRGETLDYSERSLVIVEEMLEEITGWCHELTEEQIDNLVHDFGCYILEVGRREFGGLCCWFDHRDQPVLVVGEPNFRIAMITWDKVRSRLTGDKADNIPFFYAGFAGRARRAEPGDDALYV